MTIKKQIIVTDWAKIKPKKGKFLKLKLNSEKRRILRGKRITDCNKEVHLQLPREGKLKDGDILITNQENLYVEIIAQKENVLEITSNSKIELIKVAYHLGNRHAEVEILKNIILTKNDYIIEDLLKNFDVGFLKIERKFFPESGAFNHE